MYTYSLYMQRLPRAHTTAVDDGCNYPQTREFLASFFSFLAFHGLSTLAIVTNMPPSTSSYNSESCPNFLLSVTVSAGSLREPVAILE